MAARKAIQTISQKIKALKKLKKQVKGKAKAKKFFKDKLGKQITREGDLAASKTKHQKSVEALDRTKNPYGRYLDNPKKMRADGFKDEFWEIKGFAKGGPVYNNRGIRVPGMRYGN